ncbi:hypothetical protein ANRL3_00683 [Anaerolineae bacterium]|nr:hypothetical protein ANRL3_00683 [Anaerolineae bacterium]
MNRKFALIIGNSEFDDKAIPKLDKPEADVDGLVSVLRDQERGGFDEVTPLVNQPFAVVYKEVARFFERVGKERSGMALLYFSSHGLTDNPGRLYLAAKNTEKALPKGTAIPSSFITQLVDDSGSRQTVLILDCCFAGAFPRGTRGENPKTANVEAAFVGNGRGRAVLTATDSIHYAWEDSAALGPIENSVFTHWLIKGLRGEADANGDGLITLDELYSYTYQQVISVRPEQTPLKWTYGQQGDIVIARNPQPTAKFSLMTIEAKEQQALLEQIAQLLLLAERQPGEAVKQYDDLARKIELRKELNISEIQAQLDAVKAKIKEFDWRSPLMSEAAEWFGKKNFARATSVTELMRRFNG